MITAPFHPNGLELTFNTTEDCNLRCKYCYEINKKKKELPLEYAYEFLKIILSDENPTLIDDDDPLKLIFEKQLILAFIGGDSLIAPDYLDNLFTYIYKLLNSNIVCNKNYKDNYLMSISSNGTLFDDKTRKLCEFWAPLLRVTVSIDGCPELHDMNRIYPNGKGSLDTILKSWDWYKKIFPVDALSTKSTLSKDSIPYIYKSLKYMHEQLGIIYIHQNFIMEQTFCTEDDYKLLISEFNKCIEYILNNRNSIYYTMFEKSRFALHKLSEGSDWYKKGHCGSGAMPCLGINGNIYPCFRWAPHTQSKCNPEPMVAGDVWKGLYNKEVFKKVREGAYRCNCTKDTKCKTCPYESACSYCIGGCYAEFQEFKRATYICELTKIQCEYAKRYWNEYNKLENILDKDGHIEYFPIDRHYDLDKYYYDPNHIYNPE